MPTKYIVPNLQAFAEEFLKPSSDPLELPPEFDGSPENLKRLHGIHVVRYLERLEAADRGEPGYRPAELRKLLQIWRLVHEKAYIYKDLPPEAQGEVFDALADEAS